MGRADTITDIFKGDLPHSFSGEELSDGALRGLLKIAFGSCGDAVRLAFLEEPPSDAELGRMDLFCVSEIKRSKSGGCEVKMYDRMKALEFLFSYGERNKTSALLGILDALRRPAADGD